MKRTGPTTHAGTTRLLITLAALAMACLLALILTSEARAGTYRATQCNSKLGAGTGDLSFHRTSSHYIPHVACNGDGVTIRHHEGQHPTRSGRYGSWSLRSPKGARIISANVRISGQGQSGHRPELMIGDTHIASGASAGRAGRCTRSSGAARRARGCSPQGFAASSTGTAGRGVGRCSRCTGSAS